MSSTSQNSLKTEDSGNTSNRSSSTISGSYVSNKSIDSNKNEEESFQTEINKLKNILNNPSYTVFNSDCVRKKANWGKLSKIYKFDNPAFNPTQLLNDLPVISPKLNKLLNVISDLDNNDMRNHGRLFKHFIFSDIKGFQGAKVITSSLIAKGVNLAYKSKVITINKPNEDNESVSSNESSVSNVKYGKIELIPTETLLKTRSNNFYLLSSVGVFDQPISVSKKKEILANFNRRPDNVYGDIARFIVMDSGFKEGIDLFDIKYIHIFEPQSTGADQKQVIGRGTRTCGQKGLLFHPTMGWPLYVFNYDIEINERFQKSFNYSKTAFDLYLKTLNIDLRLFNFLSELENTVILGSVDYELNSNIHNFTISNSKTDNNSNSLYSSIKTIDSLKSDDFKIMGGGGGIFPPTPLGFYKTREFIKEYFSEYKWNDVKMENLCGYAGPSFEKGKLPTNPLLSKKSQNTTLTDLLTTDIIPQSVNNSSSNMSSLTLPSAAFNSSLSKLSSDYSGLSTLTDNNKVIQELPTIPDNSSPKIIKNPLKELNLYNGPLPKWLLGGGGGGIGNIMFGGASSIVKLSPSQAFIKAYFTPETPQKGVLLNWSVGTGKTCAAIATATSSFENAGYTILWVTRTTLKNDIWKNMFDQVCSDKIREIIENSEATGKSIPTEQAERMRLLSKSWSIRPMSYKQFSNLVSKQNSFYKSLVKKNGTRDPLHKTLLIIDEAHKLYGGNDLSSLERPDMNALHNALMNSYIVSGEESVRVLLMTATPITVNPMELIKLLNLCKTPNSQMPDNFEEFAQEFSLTDNGTFSPEGKARFLDEIAGYISYLNREKDARQFAQPIIEKVVVPLVENDQIQALINKYDLPSTEDPESEEYKIAMNLESEIEKHSKTLNEWVAVSNKAKFKPLLAKCDGLYKEIKKECIKSVKEDIEEIINTAKNESTKLKEQIQKIKDELKEMNVFKKNKIREIRNNIKNAGEDYNQFKESIYNNLKNVCGKKVKDIKTLKSVTEELPEIIEINNLIKEMEERIKEVNLDFKNKIESFKKHIEVLKEELKTPGLSNIEKNNIKTHIISEKKRTLNENKLGKKKKKKITNKLKKKKK